MSSSPRGNALRWTVHFLGQELTRGVNPAEPNYSGGLQGSMVIERLAGCYRGVAEVESALRTRGGRRARV
jgi:hypothetical protein